VKHKIYIDDTTPSYGQTHSRRVEVICEKWTQALIIMGH